MHNLIQNCIILADLPVFKGSYKSAKFSHNVRVKALIVKESYGSEKGQHTFLLNIIETTDEVSFSVGKKYKKMGRNLYPAIVEVEYPQNHIEIAEEKENRAKTQSAKAKRNASEKN